MLVHLRVRDLVLIEELDLDLAPGLNVLTGETGAGKSLVATAIGLLLGRKVPGEVVRRGAGEAEVEGLFDVSDETEVRAGIVEAGLPDGEDLLIRRVLPAEGRQKCFANGRISSLAVLGELSKDLLSFAGQHEHLTLLDAAKQRDLVDAFGKLESAVSRMGELAVALREADQRLRDLKDKERDRAQRLDYLAFQLREIEALAPRPGEIEELSAEIERVKHRGETTGAARGAAEDLYEADRSVYERLSAHAAAIEAAARHDDVLEEEARALSEAASIVEETSRRLGRYGDGTDDEPDRLDELIERLDALRTLTRKHGTDLEGVIAATEEIAREVAELSGYEEALTRAEAERDRARKEARRHAKALTASRRAAAKKLGRAVAGELADLKLAGARFEADMKKVEGDPGPTGADRLEFLVALNAGEGTHPLREVASGGELSRVMLALRRALAGVGPVGTYVFDEVDAGIGGAEAALVGKKLREVARHHQVVCVTHLAQIAGLADEHFVVKKSEEGGRTRTEVRRLNGEERVAELARMLGGEKPTKKTVAAARELMAKKERS